MSRSKRILITGAGSGIGLDTAFALARRGHDVILTTHTESEVSQTKKLAQEEGVTLKVTKLDITQESEIKRAAKLEVDVLINNAAIGESGPMLEVPPERVRQLFETNVFGTLRTTQVFADAMLKRKKGGRIITVSSVAGRVVIPFLGPYHMSKFSLEAAFDAFRLELEPEGIWISLIEPGLIYTGFNERMADTKYEWLQADSVYKKNIPSMRHHDSTLTLRSHGTESVVKAMIHAVESNKPKTRYVRPKSYKRVLLALSFLPTRLRDKLIRRSMGL